jgi:hypothetical protein
MGQDSIDKVLAERKTAAQPATEAEGDKFFSILVGDGEAEHYLELKMRDGLRICLSYTDLSWFSYDPQGPKIDLEFGGIFVTIKGNGLGEALFNGIKQKRVGWVKEADTEMQNHPGNKIFIEEITFLTKQEETAPAG